MLGVYERPYSPQRLVICLDEKSKELHATLRKALMMEPGQPTRQDYEHARYGTAPLLLALEPLRKACVTERQWLPLHNLS